MRDRATHGERRIILDIRKYNEKAWDKKVTENSPWTLPVDKELVAKARKGQWSIVLTPVKPVPFGWFPGFPDMTGCKILGLASGGGQQGPILSAAGATVTVFDNSPAQLAQDRLVADRDNLQINTVVGDMTDLSCFDNASFDLIFHPVSNCFIADPEPVWREAFRVLKPGGSLLSGIMNPDYYVFDSQKAEKEGLLEVRHPLPYSDMNHLTKSELSTQFKEREALEFSHTMETLVGGQIEAGFQLTGFYEDRFGPEVGDTVSQFMPVCFATKVHKPG
ncbi:MAG: class I SAM-dependent methyltransferase [Gemmatimonadales bacterium]|nr:class I SAM-dependent methyltransferase [Gemmatimonadales bacterium]